MTGTATFSTCQRYRYTLSRDWSAEMLALPGINHSVATSRIGWLMLNPSTADATDDDNTIRRCIGYSKLWGFGSLEIRNLFALRSTDPKGLLQVRDPIGPENDSAILDLCGSCELIVCAWGNHGSLKGRSADVLDLLRRFDTPLRHLGLTQGGEPRHPLYLAAGCELREWE